MNTPNVYFFPVGNNIKNVSEISLKLLKNLITKEKIKLSSEVPLKVHAGEPGNVSFIRPQNFQSVIDFLISENIKTYFIETNTVTGQRSSAKSHKKVANDHGFTKIPFIIADGETGEDYVSIPVNKGKHFKEVKIAEKLAKLEQIIIMTHFKGHIATGFGGAIKMLGLGFASRRGKIELHSKEKFYQRDTINWADGKKQYWGEIFSQRVAEYAQGAVNKKQYIYLTYALNLVENCDCDGAVMEPLYENLGIFASTDPVAIDKAVFDMLKKREGKLPYNGEEIFPYAEKIGIGSQKYNLIEL